MNLGWPEAKVVRQSVTYGDCVMLESEKITSAVVADTCNQVITRAVNAMRDKGLEVGVLHCRIIFKLTDAKLLDDPESIPALSIGWKCEVDE
jgi:hypothetical protein